MRTTQIAVLVLWLLVSAPLSFSAPIPLSDGPPTLELSQPGQVAAPSIVKRDQPTRITHPKGAKIQAIFVKNGEWVFLPDGHFHREETYTVMAAPPATYLITTGGSTIVKVVDESRPEPEPEPSPGPDPPGPEPGPAPILAKWALWFEERTERSEHPEATAVMTDYQARQELEQRGLKVRLYDDDQQAAKQLLHLTDSKPLPVFVLYDDVAKEHRSFPAPRSVEELQGIIQENVLR